MQRHQISAREFLASPYAKPVKPRRYRNVPVVVDGVRYDSKKEHARWCELLLLQRGGEISDLRRQVPFPLAINGVTVAHYVADAVYLDHAGKRVIEDTKSDITRKDPTYRLKAKMMAVLHQPIVEV